MSIFVESTDNEAIRIRLNLKIEMIFQIMKNMYV